MDIKIPDGFKPSKIEFVPIDKEFDMHNEEDAVVEFYKFLREYTWHGCRMDNPDVSFEDYLEISLRSYCENKWGTGFPK